MPSRRKMQGLLRLGDAVAHRPSYDSSEYTTWVRNTQYLAVAMKALVSECEIQGECTYRVIENGFDAAFPSEVPGKDRCDGNRQSDDNLPKRTVWCDLSQAHDGPCSFQGAYSE